MITLHRFVPAFGLPDMSPFVVKVETYLRMTGREYRAVSADVRKAPKRKLPVIEDGDTRVVDSDAIIAHLERGGSGLDTPLTPPQRALARAVQSMVEEHLYWVIVYFRWQDDDGFRAFSPALDPLGDAMGIPRLARAMMKRVVRRQWLRQLHNQGIGRHSRDEVIAIAIRLIDALDELIVSEPFFFGDSPSSLDATLYAFLAVLTRTPIDTPVQHHVRSKAKLMRYLEQMDARYWAP